MSKSISLTWEADKPLFHNRILPSSFRLLIVGKTNSGKTYLMRILLLYGYLDFNNIVFFSTSLSQMEYKIIIQGYKKGLRNEHLIRLFQVQKTIPDPLKAIENTASLLTERNQIECEAYKKDSKIPSPRKFDKKKKNLIIFDDCAYGDQSNIHKFFFKGRHNSINSIYLTQNYFQLPRKSIRANCECFILFKMNKKDLTHFWTDHCSDDFEKFDDFYKYCSDIWKEDHGYVYIDITKNRKEEKYLSNCFTQSSSNCSNKVKTVSA